MGLGEKVKYQTEEKAIGLTVEAQPQPRALVHPGRANPEKQQNLNKKIDRYWSNIFIKTLGKQSCVTEISRRKRKRRQPASNHHPQLERINKSRETVLKYKDKFWEDIFFKVTVMNLENKRANEDRKEKKRKCEQQHSGRTVRVDTEPYSTTPMKELIIIAEEMDWEEVPSNKKSWRQWIGLYLVKA